MAPTERGNGTSLSFSSVVFSAGQGPVPSLSRDYVNTWWEMFWLAQLGAALKGTCIPNTTGRKHQSAGSDLEEAHQLLAMGPRSIKVKPVLL